MSVDWTKPIQTRSGDRVRLVGTVNYGGARETRVVVRIGKDGKDFKRLWECYDDGRQLGESDIINVPPRKETREVEAWAIVNDAGEVDFVRDRFSQNATATVAGISDARIVRLTGTVEVEVPE